MILSVVFLASVLYPYAKKASADRIITISVLGILAVFAIVGSVNAHQNLSNQYQQARETHDRNTARSTEQIKQIASTYDMADLNLEDAPAPLCGPDTQTQRIEATWPGGYGTLVIGTPQNNQCRIDIFDTTGTRLEPKH